MNNTKIKTYTFALVGLILFSSGLCLFGESIIFKYESKEWFFSGTVSLILINLGLGLMIKNNEPYLTLGSPGGFGIIQYLFQVLSHVLNYKIDLQSSIIKYLKNLRCLEQNRMTWKLPTLLFMN